MRRRRAQRTPSASTCKRIIFRSIYFRRSNALGRARWFYGAGRAMASSTPKSSSIRFTAPTAKPCGKRLPHAPHRRLRLQTSLVRRRPAIPRRRKSRVAAVLQSLQSLVRPRLLAPVLRRPPIPYQSSRLVSPATASLTNPHKCWRSARRSIAALGVQCHADSRGRCSAALCEVAAWHCRAVSSDPRGRRAVSSDPRGRRAVSSDPRTAPFSRAESSEFIAASSGRRGNQSLLPPPVPWILHSSIKSSPPPPPSRSSEFIAASSAVEIVNVSRIPRGPRGPGSRRIAAPRDPSRARLLLTKVHLGRNCCPCQANVLFSNGPLNRNRCCSDLR